MRLWHQEMIPNLSRQHLLGQHRECAALRGKGWGRKHSTVDYVFTYPYHSLFIYHLLIMKEMDNRGYKPDILWWSPSYRGKLIGYDTSVDFSSTTCIVPSENIYKEHNEEYFKECLENLKSKGFDISQYLCDN